MPCVVTRASAKAQTQGSGKCMFVTPAGSQKQVDLVVSHIYIQVHNCKYIQKRLGMSIFFLAKFQNISVLY